MEEAKQIMQLFDSLWFELNILEKIPSLANSSPSEAALVHENEDQQSSKQEVLRFPSIPVRSMSEDLSSKLTSFTNDGSLSPDSVLRSLSGPKLTTIVSGKESSTEDVHVNHASHKHEVMTSSKVERRTRRKKRGSKSLTDLQFEELKGFMDLGFVFSEEDKDSNLASIIPGLRKLGSVELQKNEAFVDEEEEEDISRPYLSEAWEVMERREKEKEKKKKKKALMMEWRFPSLSNEVDMKDNLRHWAHSVASTVR